MIEPLAESCVTEFHVSPLCRSFWTPDLSGNGRNAVLRQRFVLRSIVLAAAMSVVGAGTATAFSYGTLNVSHDGSLRGRGYGTFTAVGYNGARLTSVLADTRKDGTRTFSS